MSICVVCGNHILKESRFKPRQYCSDNCSDYNKYKTALEKCLLSMNCLFESKRVVRGDMFRLANILSNRTNTKKEN